MTTWRLEVKGEKVNASLFLTYEQLAQMEMIEKKVILICPGFFVDYAEWEEFLFPPYLKKQKWKKATRLLPFMVLMDTPAAFLEKKRIGENCTI